MPPSLEAELFAALGDETRLGLIARLCSGGPQSISGLSAGFDVTRQAISKHLRVMEQAGLVTHLRSGRESVWQIERERLKVASHYLEQISRQWDDSLERLRTFVES